MLKLIEAKSATAPQENENHFSSSSDTAADLSKNSYAVSATHLLNLHDALGNLDSEDWAGGSGARYELQKLAFRNQIIQAAAANSQVDSIVQMQDDQINQTRKTLDNTLNGLQAAIPVAQALYFSGPAGPALSYHFQLAVATPAMGTATETTNNMESNAKEHGERLTALIQEYDEALKLIPAANSGESLSSKSTIPMVADPDCIRALAPCHQHAADTFDTATKTVYGSAATISADHGMVCNASKDALQNVEKAHNKLTAAMQKYSVDLVATLPAVAHAYENTDELVAKSLNRQLF